MREARTGWDYPAWGKSSPASHWLKSSSKELKSKALSTAGGEETSDVGADGGGDAPVLTGELARSIDYGKGNRPDTWRAGTNLFRAHFTEFGTVNAPAKPFLFPAFEAKRQEIVERIAAAKLRGAIRGAIR